MSLSRLLSVFPSTVTPALAEAGNGVVLPILAVVMVALVVNVIERWHVVRHDHEPWHSFRPVRQAWRDRKAVLALLALLSGLELKTLMIWLVRHLENHGVYAASVLPKAVVPLAFVAGTAMIIVGSSCWLRVTFPDLFGGKTVASVLIVVCVAWGVWMAT